MGKKDTITKEYVKNPVVFADAFNKFLYHGNPRINPNQLRELDSAEITIPYHANGVSIPEQKYRDVLKAMTDGNTAYCIMGIENQADIHYAMPVKNGVYDFLHLAHQVSETARSHKKQQKENSKIKISSSEYLSGFWKTDKLIPVITLVIYFGAEEWDAPLSLKEMYANQDFTILEHVADYRINLIAPKEIPDEEMREFRSSLREVMLYIKHSQDRKELERIIKTDPNFRNIDRQAADVINVVTGSKLTYPEGRETIDMCLAIEEMRSESERIGEFRGEIRGAVLMCKNLGISLAETIQKISEQFHLTESESNKAVKQYWH